MENNFCVIAPLFFYFFLYILVIRWNTGVLHIPTFTEAEDKTQTKPYRNSGWFGVILTLGKKVQIIVASQLRKHAFSVPRKNRIIINYAYWLWVKVDFTVTLVGVTKVL